MAIYFTSDLHLGHGNIIKYCNRPFSGVEEMNEVLIENWNRKVDDNDKIFVLGDFSLSNSANIIKWGKALKGNKMLILGNHDHASKSVYLEAGFKEVSSYPILWDGRFILSHLPLYPAESHSNMHFCNIYGHVHDKLPYEDTPDHCCICVEQTNYEPISYTELLARIKSKEK